LTKFNVEIKSAIEVATFLSLWLLLWLPLAIPLALKLKWRPFRASQSEQKLPLLLVLYALAPLALWLYASARKPQNLIASLAGCGMPFQPVLFISAGWGLLIGAGSLLAVFLGQVRAGWLQQTVSPDSSRFKLAFRLLALLGLALWVGWTEELIFRGLIQNQLQSGLGQGLSGWPAAMPAAMPAAILTSLLFAGLHGVWDGKAVVPQLPGLWLMGMVLTLARQVDGGNLGLAWGLHAGWVWVIASLDALQLTHYTGKAPAWLTGLAGQPLAGLIGLGFLLITGSGLWLW
jgi:uncharacterized protein